MIFVLKNVRSPRSLLRSLQWPRVSVDVNNYVASFLTLADMAEAAFYLCAYEFAIKTLNSPWCQLFDEVDAQV